MCARHRINDEYGKGGTTTNRLGWLGSHQRSVAHPASGLIRMGVRLYDPNLGRFLSVDSIEGGSANDYDYCSGDPINCFDLGGLEQKKTMSEAEQRILKESTNGRNRADGTKLTAEEQRTYREAKGKQTFNKKIDAEQRAQKQRGQPNRRGAGERGSISLGGLYAFLQAVSGRLVTPFIFVAPPDNFNLYPPSDQVA